MKPPKSEPPEHRVLVCGGRDYGLTPTERDFIFRFLSNMSKKPTVVIEGEAPGTDSVAREWAEKNNVPVEPYPADWHKHGKAAGPIRNLKMLKLGKPNVVIAFPGGRGTENMVRQAKEHGVLVVRAAPAKVMPRAGSPELEKDADEGLSPELAKAVKRGMPRPF